ncbi:hypothetical protein F4776DRAFT_634619 [Hypoxylon sp. NC0597]|nr:hypothetical protein F4776DRAFT_634619 [Hypoxylon sp. NC0597]
MPPRISLRPIGRRGPFYLKARASESNSVCFFCSLSSRPHREQDRRPRRKSKNPRRFASTASTSSDRIVVDPRKELEHVLLELEKHAANYVNLSRLQLALNGLRQKPGDESTRVAVLGLTNGSDSSQTAKQVPKLLLADPLKGEEEWEKEVDHHDLATPMIIRVGPDPVKELVASLLRNASAAIETEKARQLGSSLSSKTSPTPVNSLPSSLDDWAESAHGELQEQLDLAFSSRRWRKLGWWKLFWRVDDVGMLTNDILSQRFLPNSERSAIFLAGRMKEAGVTLGPFPNPSSTNENGAESRRSDTTSPEPEPVPWPVNIPATRRYLQTETIPALQALAQKLTLQTLSTSGLTTALGVLVYLSTLTTTLYEAGTVAALGIVWSLRRMQKKWETARAFWEGEVREEGRKAVRGVESEIAKALKQGQTPKDKVEGQEELARAKNLVERAQEILSKLKHDGASYTTYL